MSDIINHVISGIVPPLLFIMRGILGIVGESQRLLPSLPAFNEHLAPHHSIDDEEGHQHVLPIPNRNVQDLEGQARESDGDHVGGQQTKKGEVVAILQAVVEP